MLDLLTPTDHAGAYAWVTAFLSHAVVGLFLVAFVAALIDAAVIIEDAGRVALILVTGLYFGAWEGAVQWFGAGMDDAVVDTAAVALGGAVGLSAWLRNGAGVALGIAGLALISALGVWRRK